MESNSNDNMLIYRSEDGKIKIDVRFESETVWLSLDQMATLFGRDKSTISRHVKNVFEEGELSTEATVANFATVQTEGGREVSRNIDYYNLDVIISVGYRVKSQQGTQFRIWATQRLKEYIIKGFALNDERFKTGSSYNYFKELLGRIREIRLSEKVFYQQIRIFMPPVSTTILLLRRPWLFSKRCKTSCFGLSVARLPPSLCIIVPMPLCP